MRGRRRDPVHSWNTDTRAYFGRAAAFERVAIILRRIQSRGRVFLG